MIDNILLGLTVASLICVIILALMGTTVSAWWVVFWIVPVLIELVIKRLYDMT